jgi:septin family protein
MPTKPLELPLEVAKAFARDMRAFLNEESQLKRDEIAVRQLHALWAFQKPREKKLRLADVKQMFLELRDLK